MISSSVRQAGPFTGDGVTTVFPFAFKVFSTTDVQVVYTPQGGADTILTPGGTYSYTVSINQSQDTSPGGTVTLSAPLAPGSTLVVLSNVAPLQPVQLTNGGGFFPSVLNGALDRVTIIAQQIMQQMKRTLVFPASEAGNVPPIPPIGLRANGVLGFDANGGFAVLPPSTFTGPQGPQGFSAPVVSLASFIVPGENDVGLWINRAVAAGFGYIGLPFNAAGYEWHTPVNLNGSTRTIDLGGNLIRIVGTITGISGLGRASRFSNGVFTGDRSAGQVVAQIDGPPSVFDNICAFDIDKCFYMINGFEPKIVNCYGRNCVTCFAHFANGVGPIVSNFTYDTDGPWYGGTKPQPTKGAIWLQTQGAAFNNIDAIHSGLVVEVASGVNIEWGLFSQCWFDSSATQAGVDIINNQTDGTYLRGLFFKQVWSATNQFGYRIRGTCPAAAIDGIYIDGCPIHNNGYEGVRIENGINIAIDGCTILGNNADGTAATYGYTKAYVAAQVSANNASIANFTISGGRINSAGTRWNTTPLTQVDIAAGVSGSIKNVAMSGATTYGFQTRNASALFSEDTNLSPGMLGLSNADVLNTPANGYDDSAALLALIAAQTGAGRVLPGLPGGGVVVIDPHRSFYINQPIALGKFITLQGSYRRDELLDHRSDNNNYDKSATSLGAMGGTIVLGPQGYITLNDHSGIRGLAIISAPLASFRNPGVGQSLPVSAVQTLLNSYANYPLAVNTVYGACGVFVEDSFIAGFALGIKLVYNERWKVAWNKIDCLNGFYATQTYDDSRLVHNHFYPFGWGHRMADGTPGQSNLLSNYGTAIKFDTGADTSRSIDAGHIMGNLIYGFNVGIDLLTTNGLHCIDNWIDNDQTRSDNTNTIGIRTSGNCRRTKLVANHCDSVGRGYDMQGSGCLMNDNTAAGCSVSHIRWGANIILQIGNHFFQDTCPLYVEIQDGSTGNVTCSNLFFSIPNGVAFGLQGGALPASSTRATIRLGQVTVNAPQSGWSYDQTQWNHL